MRHYEADHVIRTSTQDKDLSREAEALEVVGSAGFSSARTFRKDHTVFDCGERIDGPTMLEDLTSRPWMLNRHARIARLHKALGNIVAPPSWGRRRGESVVHLDLRQGISNK